MKEIRLGAHSRRVLAERSLKLEWVEMAAREPEWTAPDHDPALERRFRAIPEAGNRVIRVVCREDNNAIFVVTAFLDRRARRPT